VGGRPRLRSEEPVEASGEQASFEFGIAAPEPSVKMQGESDERRVFAVDPGAKPTAFHPGADRNGAFIDKGDARKQSVQAIEQFVFGKLCGGGDAFLMFEQFNQ